MISEAWEHIQKLSCKAAAVVAGENASMCAGCPTRVQGRCKNSAEE